MPHLSPINWLFLFMMFWTTMMINTSIMWYDEMLMTYILLSK